MVNETNKRNEPVRYNPPYRTDQRHLQPLSNHVDCYKAAGMKADVASGPDRRTEYNPPYRTDQTHLQPLSNHVDCYKAAGMKADVASGPDRRTEWGRCRSRVGATWALRRGIAPSVEG
ncbi:unnamed protein product [Boreogadus saida]